MDISALSLHPYDHYAPELRDRMLEKLRVAMAEATGYRLLTPDLNHGRLDAYQAISAWKSSGSSWSW